MYKLMDVLVDKVAEVNLICCTFMAQLGTKLMVRHEDLLKTVSQRIVKEISQTRLTVKKQYIINKKKLHLELF